MTNYFAQHCFRSGKKREMLCHINYSGSFPVQIPQTDVQFLMTWKRWINSTTSKMTFGWGTDFSHFLSYIEWHEYEDYVTSPFQWLEYLKRNHVEFFHNLFFFFIMCGPNCYCETLYMQLCLWACLSLRLFFFFDQSVHYYWASTLRKVRVKDKPSA